jgi:hypothetical protein
MMKYFSRMLLALGLLIAGGCETYQVKPLPFKAPASFQNVTQVAGADVAARAFTDKTETKAAFGFDILGAGMLPVQVVFDNQGDHPLEINGPQSFLEDNTGNLWPILSSQTAYERASRYARTKQIFSEGAYAGFLGAAAGAIVGAAVGIVTGEGVGASAGKGAAVGAAGGVVLGGVGGYASDDARRTITSDLRDKSLQNKPVAPKSIAHGFLFFPAEAETARRLRLQLMEKDTGTVHVVRFEF